MFNKRVSTNLRSMYLLLLITAVVSAGNCAILREKNLSESTNVIYYNETVSKCPVRLKNNNSLEYIDCSNVQGDQIKLDLTEDGFLKVGESYVAPGEFCVSDSGKSATAKLCPQHSNITWKKCCPRHQVIDGENPRACVNYSRPFRPRVYGKLQSFQAKADIAHFQCKNGFHLKKLSGSLCSARAMSRFQLTSNGTLLYEVATGVFLRKSNWNELDHEQDDYCIDGVINHPVSDCSLKQASVEINTSISESLYTYDECQQDEQMAVVLYVCIPDQHSEDATNENITAKTTLLAVIWSLTCPLLLAAAVVNSFVIQKNVHGWILTCYLLSMCTLNVLSAIFIINPGNHHDGCRSIDFIIKFTYMSTLCWMTSINFGLWKTFRYTLPQAVGFRRFITSVIFSFGFPAISVTACYYVAYHGTDERCKSEYCLLYSYNTIPVYTLPMFLLVLGNFAIFVKTSYTITRLRKEAEDVLRRQAQDHLQSFSLFAKLFLLTGCIWLIRLVLFVLQVQGKYLSWYGVLLEVVFSLPEAVFPIIVFHHTEFIKWSWNKYPRVSRFILTFDPFYHVPTTK
ncbi:putative G-protein coupled receptor Mth-like 3 [Orchesella cincta]|uniref:Putative G-protein coupled receptor Mth-like 3 n=1 Tax=Orchesella cincta TaxID=48709 RepID=A0A1D2N3I7_ORCCI|nr:putative G-protein coupled receptor Mth-like 3 [Orchesella cincta]